MTVIVCPPCRQRTSLSVFVLTTPQEPGGGSAILPRDGRRDDTGHGLRHGGRRALAIPEALATVAHQRPRVRRGPTGPDTGTPCTVTGQGDFSFALDLAGIGSGVAGYVGTA